MDRIAAQWPNSKRTSPKHSGPLCCKTCHAIQHDLAVAAAIGEQPDLSIPSQRKRSCCGKSVQKVSRRGQRGEKDGKGVLLEAAPDTGPSRHLRAVRALGKGTNIPLL